MVTRPTPQIPVYCLQVGFPFRVKWPRTLTTRLICWGEGRFLPGSLGTGCLLVTIVWTLLGLKLGFRADECRWAGPLRLGVRKETILFWLRPIVKFVLLTSFRNVVKLVGCPFRVFMMVSCICRPVEGGCLLTYRLQRRKCFPSRSPGPRTMDRLRLRYIWLESPCRVVVDSKKLWNPLAQLRAAEPQQTRPRTRRWLARAVMKKVRPFPA